jgi:two-component system, NtrC family, sensor kinase
MAWRFLKAGEILSMRINSVLPVGLRLRITLTIGLLIAVLMAIVSISIIFTWRSMILQNELENAYELSSAFAVPVLDALIYSKQNPGFGNTQLQSQIHDFRQKIQAIQFVIVLDEKGELLARSDDYSDAPPDLLLSAAGKNAAACQLMEKDHYGWLIESFQPLHIGSKVWGTLHIGFDANPIHREIKRLFFRLFASTIALILVTTAALWFLVGRLTDSLRHLVKLVDRLDFDSQAFPKWVSEDDEIGILQNRFKALEGRLKDSRRQLVEAQRQIYQAEKLASIGRLSSGVAHEINNPLNGIRSCIYAMEKTPEDSSKQKRYLKLISEGLAHIEIVVQKLLDFARQRPRQFQKISWERPIEKALDLLAFRIQQRQIVIQKEYAEELPFVCADEQTLQEVAMNLILNAMDAVAGKGVIRLYLFSKANLVYFAVEDNGSGISPDYLPHVFEPFFTTKDEGKGTGLGLSVSLGLIESYNGKLTAESVLGRGSKFTVVLPAGECE